MKTESGYCKRLGYWLIQILNEKSQISREKNSGLFGKAKVYWKSAEKKPELISLKEDYEKNL